MRLSVAIAAVCLVTAWTAEARAEDFAYTIYKEDEAIGRDAYSITSNGDTHTVKVQTTSDVRVLFIEFHYRHTRTEVWKGAQLQSFESDTDDDGTKHHIKIERDGDSLSAVADGVKKNLSLDAIPFTLWTKSVMTPRSVLFDVADFQQLKLQFTDKGIDPIMIAGKKIDTRRYQISGDLHWDLWYAPDGTLLKTAFKRRGYPISFIRE